MLDWLYKWIVAVTAAGILAAVATSLVQSGPIRKVAQMTAGLVIILAVISPFTGLDVGKLSLYTTQYDALKNNYSEKIGQVNDKYVKAIIQDRTSEYILNKARELGLEIQVRVEARPVDGGYPYPWSAEIYYDGDAAGRNAVSRIIESECAIPANRQYWKTKR